MPPFKIHFNVILFARLSPMSCLLFRCSSTIYKHFPSPMHVAWPRWLIPWFSYAYLSCQVGYFLHMYPYCVSKCAYESEVSVCLILNFWRLKWLVWWEEVIQWYNARSLQEQCLLVLLEKENRVGGKIEHWDLKGDGRWIISLWCTWSKLSIWCEFRILCLKGCCMVKLW